uniref:Uncharacterized protein n=1 Tax=Anguilla anguilla TaxID=7936 RepID=A0A0E9QXL5_ANGAN
MRWPAMFPKIRSLFCRSKLRGRVAQTF